MIEAVHHVAIIVSSDEAVEFYKRLGFTIFKRVERNRDTVVLLRGYGIQLELFVDASHPARSIPEALGLRHLALKVDDIEKTSNALGLKIGSVKNDWIGERYCFTVDPDGNTIELHE